MPKSESEVEGPYSYLYRASPEGEEGGPTEYSKRAELHCGGVLGTEV